jgi:hypothetical protein
MMPTIENKTQ